MSYQVLARKWRPRSFQEMVGQEHVLRALINALDNDRLHHAFLFTGTRGVGKTTVARILAKSLNCERGVSSTPCGTCASCVEIDEGRFVDLIEVDAASRTKVEDTRELLDNVQYAPTRGRYKVYLIDEVHMLSGHSFNALLKTLEEPPPHIKFLLATTDPQKLPITILSRCLQFSLKQLPPGLIGDHLGRVLEREGIASEPAALAELARAADGSMRDALSLLDQAIAYGNGRVGASEVRDMLGTVDRGSVLGLLEALAAGDGGTLLQRVEELAAYGPDYADVLGELVSLLHRIAVMQAVPCAEGGYDPQEDLQGLADTLLPEDVQLFYQIGLIGRRDLPLAPDTRSGFEMVLLRMLAFRPLGGEPSAGTAGGGGVRPRVQAPPSRSARPQTSPEQALPARGEVADAAEPRPAAESVAAGAAGSGSQEAGEWHLIVQKLDLNGVARQLAMHCALERWENGCLELALEPAFGHLHNPKREQALREALEAHVGQPIRLRMRMTAQTTCETPAQTHQRQQEDRQRAAEAAIENDPCVQSILDRFGGRIQPGTVQPTE